MAAPFKVPLKIYQGATFFESWAWSTAPDESSAYTPVDLTGCTARMQVRAKIDATTPLLTLTTENGGISLGGTAGTIELLIDADDTAALTWTSGVYDLEIVYPGGQVTRLAYGSVTVSPEVTRA
jgi:hypothetical protein